jgi:transposase
MNLENLTTRQQARLDWVAKTAPRLHRATCSRKASDWFQLPCDEAVDALATWLGWVWQCRIAAFVDL